MAVSQNGWPLCTADQLDKSPIPGTDVSPVPGLLRGDVATLLLWVGEQFNLTVAPVYNPGCWGWNTPTPIPGSNIYSNHCSGTAIDLNAPSFPWTLRTMTDAQREACRKIVNHTEGVVAWGGDFTTKVDEMHFEINGSSDDVARIVNKLKGDDVADIVNDQDIINFYNGLTKIQPSEKEIAAYRGKTFRHVFTDVYLWAIQNKRDYMTAWAIAQTQPKDHTQIVDKPAVMDYLNKNLK